MPRWRNWQTHQVQVLAVATLWGSSPSWAQNSFKRMVQDDGLRAVRRVEIRSIGTPHTRSIRFR